RGFLGGRAPPRMAPARGGARQDPRLREPSPEPPRARRALRRARAHPAAGDRRGAVSARHAVEARDVHKRYGAVRALAGVTLDVEEGEFFGLLGPNGAGKTTLISALGGLAIADSGTLRVMGHDVRSDYRAARVCVGIVPQEIVFDPFFTVRETLE